MAKQFFIQFDNDLATKRGAANAAILLGEFTQALQLEEEIKQAEAVLFEKTEEVAGDLLDAEEYDEWGEWADHEWRSVQACATRASILYRCGNQDQGHMELLNALTNARNVFNYFGLNKGMSGAAVGIARALSEAPELLSTFDSACTDEDDTVSQEMYKAVKRQSVFPKMA